MTKRLGMDPSSVENIADALLARAGLLVASADTASIIAKKAANPLQYAVKPGSLAIAPASVSITWHVASLVGQAVADLSRLTIVLRQQALLQQHSSAASASSARILKRPKSGVVVPVGASARATFHWWMSLGERERSKLINSKPDLIGSMEGVPNGARSEANLIVLHQTLADPAASAILKDQLLQILAGYDGASKRHDGVPTQLIHLDLSNPQKVLTTIAIGDVDKAGFIATFAFGINTDISSLAKHIEGAGLQYDDLADVLASKSETAAVIVFQGYDSGNEMTVHRDEKAVEGAPKFRDFLSGLDASNQSAKRTHVAYSYATRMHTEVFRDSVGMADLQADALVFIGSPGVSQGVTDVTKLNVDAPVYTARSKTDHVATTLYRGSSDMFRTEKLHSLPPAPDPHAESWGGIALEAKTRLSKTIGHAIFDPEGGGYLNDARLLRNMSYIIAGRNDLVEH